MTAPFMENVFLDEARRAVAEIRKTGGSCGACAEALASYKGAASMLGFVPVADLCAKLGNAFSKGGDVREIVKALPEGAFRLLSELSETEAGKVAEFVQSREGEFVAFAAQAEDAARGIYARDRRTKTPATSIGAVAKPDIVETDIDPEIRELFVREMRERCGMLASELVALDSGEGGGYSDIDALMRVSHSIKGAARVARLDGIVELANLLEECFVAAKGGKISVKGENCDVLLACSDFLAAMCADDFGHIDNSRLSELQGALALLRAGKKAKVSAAGAPRNAGGSDAGRIPRGSEESWVRVSAKNLDSMMELAAESMIENRRIETYREGLEALKAAHERMAEGLDKAVEAVSALDGSAYALARLESVRKAFDTVSAEVRERGVWLAEYARDNILIADKLYAEILAGRMRPLEDAIAPFPRLVRDIARSSGKKISLEIVGRETAVDRDVLEKLDAPISHLLRNACDHGIEPPAERVKAGKPPEGKITMRAWHSGGYLMLSIADDGVGIDEKKVRAKILERKLVSESILSKLTSSELYDFLFLPGFTTRDTVGDISGRGVGLDVVQTMLREIGGVVSLKSEKGKGCEFIMKMPVTRSVIRVLEVRIDGQLYAFPLAKIFRTIASEDASAHADFDAGTFVADSRQGRVVSAAKVLGFESEGCRGSYIVAVSGKSGLFGFAVDGLPTETELVIRPLDNVTGKVPCVLASALERDGEPVLILDVDDMLVPAEKILAGETDNPENSAHIRNASPDAKKVLVADDSETVRQTERRLLEHAGFSVETAVDGMDAWNCFRLGQFDLVVTDIDMPRMTGIEFTQRIRKSGSKIPVAVVSYKNRESDIDEAHRAGVDLFLAKSAFEDGSFLKQISALLENKKS